jgi:hypothetical protein
MPADENSHSASITLKKYDIKLKIYLIVVTYFRFWVEIPVFLSNIEFCEFCELS